MTSQRTATIKRETSESSIELSIDLDGTGTSSIDTSVPFYDHMLTAFSKHSLIDLTVKASGDTHIDVHHTVEDIGIALGLAIKQALGDKAGISRYGDALVPLDEALVRAVVDVSGRPYLVHSGEPAGFEMHLIGGHFTGSMVRHVFEAISFNAGITVTSRFWVGATRTTLLRPSSRRLLERCAVLLNRMLVSPVSLRRRARCNVADPSVVILDYGSGNVHSAAKALEAAGANVRLSADRSVAEAADGLLVPGVGAFAAVMSALESVRGGAIIEKRLTGSRPVLGICVGMQVMFSSGDEHGVQTDGLDEWPGVVEKLPAPVLPHMGWNTVETPDDTTLFDSVRDKRFYFVHSYAAQQWTLDVQPPFPQPKLTWAEHGGRFIAAVENGPLTATQFHPEKSGEAGIQLLRNWLKSL